MKLDFEQRLSIHDALMEAAQDKARFTWLDSQIEEPRPELRLPIDHQNYRNRPWGESWRSE